MFKTEFNVNQKSLVDRLTLEASAQAKFNNVLITKHVGYVYMCMYIAVFTGSFVSGGFFFLLSSFGSSCSSVFKWASWLGELAGSAWRTLCGIFKVESQVFPALCFFSCPSRVNVSFLWLRVRQPVITWHVGHRFPYSCVSACNVAGSK